MTIRGVLSSTGASRVVLDAVRAGRIALVGSRPCFSDLHRTLARPRIARRLGITPRRRRRLVSRFYALAVLVEPRGRVVICCDPNDDYLIEMALLSRATYLVTEDDDLHDYPAISALLRRHGTELVRSGEFVRLHLQLD